MKKVTLLFIPIFVAGLFQACNSNKNKNSDTEDTATAIVDTSKKVTIIVDKDDINFVTGVASACMAEIKIGNLAKQKAQDKRIRNFGVMMNKDLSKGKAKLVALAKAKKITLPDSISAADEKGIDELTKVSGRNFDDAYLAKTKADHKRAIELFQDAAKHAYDPDIKGFASKNLLTLQRHLDAIDAIHGSMKQ